jgi:hypothetical protein
VRFCSRAGHLRKLEKTVAAHNLVPSEFGARNNISAHGLPDSADRHRTLAVSDQQNLSDSLRACAGNKEIMTRRISRHVRAPLQL